VVRRMGGWQYICEHHGLALNPGQFFAQARELVKSKLEIEESGVTDMSHLLNGPKSEMKQLSAPPQFTQEETEKIAQITQGQPRELVENFLQALAKSKSMNNEGHNG
jgi:F0F1-type ATP synthase delta subunit